MNRYTVVAGGANLDIAGCSKSELIFKDSNPGSIRFLPGGVGRNIAHNLRLLEEEVMLLTAIGEDLSGRRIIESCTEDGMDISEVLTVSDMPSSCYMYISGPDGDMQLAVNEMDICSRLDAAYFASKRERIEKASALVVDANLDREAIEYLLTTFRIPIFADPVSTVKGVRFNGLLKYIHTLKPNRLEAELLSGIKIETETDIERAADILLEKGVKNVYISLGERGMFAANEEKHVLVPACHATVTNMTGAGDAALAALVKAYYMGLGCEETAAMANRTASSIR